MTAATYLEDWGLTPDDDNFHPPSDDPWWTETVLFAWFVPERRLIGYFYPIFRPNLGVQAGGVVVFDSEAYLPWEIPVFNWDWTRPLAPDVDLRNAELENGMSIRCLEPGRHFELGYESRDLSLDLHVEAVAKPLVTLAEPPFNKGHLDQLCRVSGSMVLTGERIDVDAFAIRARSWGPRQDGRQPQVAYDYAARDAENAFLAISVGRDRLYDVTSGFLIREGTWSRLTLGKREAVYDDLGRPVTIAITASDEEGRQISADGAVVSQQVLQSYPSMAC